MYICFCVRDALYIILVLAGTYFDYLAQEVRTILCKLVDDSGLSRSKVLCGLLLILKSQGQTFSINWLSDADSVNPCLQSTLCKSWPLFVLSYDGHYNIFGYIYF